MKNCSVLCEVPEVKNIVEYVPGFEVGEQEVTVF